MKIFNFRALLVAMSAFALFLSSCGDDDGDPEDLNPTIVFNDQGGTITSDTEVTPGSTVSFNVVFTKGNDGKKLDKIYAEVNDARVGGGTQPIDVQFLNADELEDNSYIDVNDDSYTLSVTDYALGTAEGEVTFIFRTEDRDGNSNSRQIMVTVVDPDTSNNDTTPDVTTPRSLSVNLLDTQPFLAIFSTPNARSEADADANASPINARWFYSQATDSYNLVSSTALAKAAYDGTNVEWDAGAGSMGLTLYDVSADFSAQASADQSQLASIVAAGTATTFTGNDPGDRTSVAAGDVYGFTANNQNGLIRVDAVSQTSVELTILVDDNQE